MTLECDLVVIGSGFGGSLLSMIARRLGMRVVLLERGRHPRFAIGESASPLAGILIEQLADRYDLPRVRPLSAYGTWQRAYPEIVCGVKRGFTYFRHETGAVYRPAADRSNQLLVAASPSDELSDTHWLRSDVDHFLVREAMVLGVEYLDGVELDGMDEDAQVQTVRGHRGGARLHVRAPLVVDASGPRGFLSRARGIANAGFETYPPTQALFSHFAGVTRCDAMPDYDAGGHPPYPIDDAALHHVFDGGWMWVLRFGNGITSAGVAVTDDVAAGVGLADGEPAWHRLLARYPSIAAQFAGSEPIREFTWMPRLAWRTRGAAGPGLPERLGGVPRGWAMLPSAAAFIDPLFSTGIPLTLLGIERLARWFEGRPASDYERTTLAEADHTARFIAGCYAAFPRFEQFAAYSMFYFAAASYSEMARRLGVQPVSARFLGADRDAFREATVHLSPQRRGWDDEYARDVAAAIEPLNIAGLCDRGKRNWYAIDFDDAIRGAGKLGVSAERVVAMLRDVVQSAGSEKRPQRRSHAEITRSRDTPSR